MSQDYSPPDHPPAFTAPPGHKPADHIIRPDADSGVGSFRIPDSGPLSGLHVVLAGFGVQGHHTAARLALFGARLTIIDDGELNTPESNGSWVMTYHPLDPMVAAKTKAYELDWALMRGTLFPASLIAWEPTVLENSASAGAFSPEMSELRGFTLTPPRDQRFPHRATLLTQVAPTEKINQYIRRSLEASPRVTFVRRHIADANELVGLVREYDADLVVNSTGIEFAYMYDDRRMRLQYGALAWLKIPDGWAGGVRSRDLGVSTKGFGHGKYPATSDPIYITQSTMGRIAVGGVMWPMKRKDARALIESGFEVDDKIIEGIISRAEEHFPELVGLERLGATCSIRPGRSSRLFEYDTEERRVLHCGGQGGSGVTMAPYVARSIAALLLDRVGAAGC